MAIENLPLGVTGVMLYELDFAEQLALCQKLGVTHYSLRPRIIPDAVRDKPYSSHGNHKFDLTPQRLVAEARQIRKQMDDAGITPFGTVPAVNVEASDDDLKLHFEGAAAVGAGRVRVQPLGYPRSGRFDYQDVLARTVDRYGRVVEIAKGYKVKAVIETHSFSLASSPALALNICRHFAPSEVGTIFDIANFHIEGSLQPNLAVAVLDQYIDHVHIGATTITDGEYDAIGFRKRGRQGSVMTECHLYIPEWLQALRDLERTVPLIIECYNPNMLGGFQLTQAAEDLKRALTAL